eukprot:SAG22_NODE_11019_length_505_cov_0.495074_1_plen_61_part_10
MAGVRDWGLAAFYAAYGLAFAVIFAVTNAQHPLVPFDLVHAGWSAAWLLTTVVDYYGAAFV